MAILLQQFSLNYEKFLHLVDNSRMMPRGQPGHSKIFKVEHVVNSLVQNYKFSYIMKKEVSVDESMIAYKGRLSFLQYMPKKPHKWGIKAWYKGMTMYPTWSCPMTSMSNGLHVTDVF